MLMLAVMLVVFAVWKARPEAEDMKVTVARVFVVQTMKTPLMSYSLSAQGYPTTAQGLRALLVPPDGAVDWRGPYVEHLPLDPWGRAFRYRFPGARDPKQYDLWSAGPDGVDGTADDIGNWGRDAAKFTPGK